MVFECGQRPIVPRSAKTTEEVVVKVFAERTTDAIQSDRIDARINEAEAKAYDSEHVPEVIEIPFGCWVKVKPH